jgi:hypothetical protein
MKTGIQAYEREMKERKLELGMGKGERGGKGDGILSSKVVLCGRAMNY